MRLVGGTLYLVGFSVLAWNLWRTARAGRAVDGSVEVPSVAFDDGASEASVLLGRPVIVTLLIGGAVIGSAALDRVGATLVLVGIGLFAIILGALSYERATSQEAPHAPSWHRLVEGKGFSFTALTIVAVLIGGVAEIVPSVIAGGERLRITKSKPYAALELEGRDVFLKEGCYNCHSQMIRPFTWETARYGEVSAEDDSIFDHPFQWGSKRTGPDLARVGGRYSNLWHYKHMLDPREISPGSNMPSYAHLASARVDFAETPESCARCARWACPTSRSRSRARRGMRASQAS
jgi:cytochrome c oxidase cbb3-type subunit I/II